ncbi:MAG TPA: chitobiase/beta-hexosaminidase C-terminal domain-containing protein [Acidobacteriaceae bacterium]|nr:chitobiase/beta-hexosaminidase C-terminal domain-containing protein [Acidobacteriaceae bacterium]
MGTDQLNATANVAGSFVYTPAAGTVLPAGAHTLMANFTPTDSASYAAASATVTLRVGQATPVISWQNPANVAAGTPLSSSQLDATANVAGAFSYSPAAGTVLSEGTHTLTATFTPADTGSYTTATATVTATVTATANGGQATPVISWQTPANVGAGTALSSTQLDATANVAGAFSYSPAAGTVLSEGTHTLTATFTPADTADYATATATVTLTVGQAAPVITWKSPASIPSGTALSGTQLNATANVAGTFSYSPAPGTVLAVGTHSLSATFTPTDTGDYTAATATNSIVVTTASANATGPVVNVDPSMSTQQLQSAISGAANGSTIEFAAGTYDITSSITLPCNNLQITGPAATPPTAILSASFTNSTIFAYNGGCAALGSIRYLHFENTGAVYFGVGNNSNFDFEDNLVTNLPSNQSNPNSEAGLMFDGSLSTTLNQVVIEHNTFGDPNSCTDIFSSSTDEGGYCAGVITSQGEDENLTIQYNNFVHVEEGIHFNQLASYNPGQPNSVCVTCTVEYNTIVNYHRIGIEIQVSTPTDSILVEHNSVVDPMNSSYGTYAVSLACCQWGSTMGTEGFSPGVVFSDNVLVASLPCGGECPPYGVEFWGTGSQGTNSLVEGSFSNGYTWGFGAGSWAINNNYVCGPDYVNDGGYISNEEGQSNTPSQSGDVTSPGCSVTASQAPTISPAGGSFSGSQVVTLSDAGANTGIWYTTDGSTPVPGSGTAQYYTGPFTINSTTTVRAVGMWGSANQPTSYAAGYGYVPSNTVSSTFQSQ